MRHITKHIYLCLFAASFAYIMVGCKAKGNYPGTDFMPDMGPSLAYEANYHIDYENSYLKFSHRKFSADSTYNVYSMVKQPVTGTIPRGEFSNGRSLSYMQQFDADMVDKPMNGSVPYNYPNTEAGRQAASSNITSNPYPITTAGLAQGKLMWNTYCAVCHGQKMDGNGVIVANGAYPAAPPAFTGDEWVQSEEGRYYHAIMHGKGVMGHYKDKLSDKERWEVIHYIRSKQIPGYADNALDKSSVDFSSALKSANKDTTYILQNVFFETGSSFLKPISTYELNTLADALQSNSSISIELGGHTDNVGNSDSNQLLSQKRADSVRDYLISKGVSPARLGSVGYGSNAPAASNATEQGRSKNRRTEFKLL